jgi:hypothetical protein
MKGYICTKHGILGTDGKKYFGAWGEIKNFPKKKKYSISGKLAIEHSEVSSVLYIGDK